MLCAILSGNAAHLMAMNCILMGTILGRIDSGGARCMIMRMIMILKRRLLGAEARFTRWR